MKRRNDNEAEALTFNLHANLSEDALELDDEEGEAGSCDSQQVSDSLANIFAMAQKFPRLEKSVEAKLISDAKAGSNYARNTLTKHNFHLLIGCAKNCAKNFGWHWFEDLVQEGAKNFNTIISTFDPLEGRFDTHATFCLRRVMMQYIDKHGRFSSVRYARLARKVNRLEQNLGREPSSSEIKDHLHVSMDTVRLINQLKLSNQAVGRSGTRETNEDVVNSVVDEKEVTESLAESHELLETMQKAFSSLTPVQLSVIRLRYGLESGTQAASYGEIARILGLGHRKAAERADKRALKVLGKHLKGWEG